MTCKDFEKTIYLYAESSVEERACLDEHILTCAHCRELMTSRVQFGKRLKSTRRDPVPDFPGALSNRIMASLENQSRSPLTGIFDAFALKFAMAAASLILTMFFAYELTIVQPAPAAGGNNSGRDLNSHQFFVTRKPSEAKRPSLYSIVKKHRSENQLSGFYK